MSIKIDFSKPLSAFEIQYTKDRPWLIGDAERQGFQIDLDGGEPEIIEENLTDETADELGIDKSEDDEESSDTETDEDAVPPYEEWTVAQLKEQIEAINAEADEDNQIVPDGTKKADLIAALEAYDAAHAEDEDDEESSDTED